MNFLSADFKARGLLLFLLGFACMLHAATVPNALPGYVIVPLGRGHINRYCLAATIGGTKGLAILDTGATHTALNASTFRALLANDGNRPPNMPKTVKVNGMTSPLVMAPNLQVANVTFGKFPVALVPARDLFTAAIGSSGDRTYDLLLGEEFLRNYRALVDCGRLALYLNVNPAKHLSLSSAFVAGGWTRVPMTDLGNDFTVPCSVNGHAFRLIVDTGAGFSVLNHGQVNAMGISGRELPWVHGGLVGTVGSTVSLVTIDGLHVGGYLAPESHMVVTDQSYSMFTPPHEQSHEGIVAGLLGPDLLSHNNAIVDVGNKALYLKRP